MLDFDNINSDKILIRYDIRTESSENIEDIAAKLSPKDPILKKVVEDIFRSRTNLIEDDVRTALKSFAPEIVIQDGLLKGMDVVTELYIHGIFYLHHVMVAADTFERGLKVVEGAMSTEKKTKGTIVMHVAEGDPHDIGKNVAAVLLRGVGYKVVDLGRNVPVEEVVDAVFKNKPNFLTGTALMTTTMSAFPRIAAKLAENDIHIPFLCAGGAVNREFVESFDMGVYVATAKEGPHLAAKIVDGWSWHRLREKWDDIIAGKNGGGSHGTKSMGKEPKMSKCIESDRTERWVQANVWRADSINNIAHSLSPNEWNLLGIHIGPTEAERTDTPFPDTEIDFSAGEVTITVVLELDGAIVKPLDKLEISAIRSDGSGVLWPMDLKDPDQLIKPLFSLLSKQTSRFLTDEKAALLVGQAISESILPPIGDSSVALFAVKPQASIEKVEGRLSFSHNNRVLQTAKLSIGVSTQVDQETIIVVEAEETIHPRFDDLKERRQYDVAIQVSNVGGEIHLLFQRNGILTSAQLNDLSDPILKIQQALEHIALKWDYSRPMLQQPEFEKSIYKLAATGSDLEQHLRRICGDDIDDWKRIHLVPQTERFLPLEYVYDGPPPRIGAKICPNISGALEGGSCDLAIRESASSIACPHQGDITYICPMHFWGFHRLIERNGVLRVNDSSVKDTTVTPSSVCVPTKGRYGRARCILFAASNRAFRYKDDLQDQANERAKLVESFQTLSCPVSDVADWEEWRNELGRNPNLFIVIAHTDEYCGTPVLEIGDGKLLGRHEIPSFMKCDTNNPQLLILLGCSAADVAENFQPYPQKFRDAGVSIVLAPVAPIRGADAIPIAKKIAQVLADHIINQEPTPFGDFLPMLRRELLRDGHPGIMGLLGFGDGDWLLGGQQC